MKYFTTLLYLAASYIATAQSHIDITQSDTSLHWLYSHDPCSLNGCTHSETSEHFLGRDTVVHGVTYALTYDGLQKRCIREDAQHRVYGLDDNDTVETLLFDFDAQVHDTIDFHGFFAGASHQYYYIIDSIDSIDISRGGGVYRRTWYVTTDIDTIGATPGIPLIWIEGIGEELNGLHSIFTRDFTTGFGFCGVYDSTAVFSVYDRCYKILGIIGTPATGLLHVYPTPATDVLSIENNTGERMTSYGLTDLSGHSVYAGAIEERNNAGIPIGSLPAGLYFLRIADERGNVYTQKVVKR